MQPIEEIFHLCKDSLPDDWQWCTVYFKSGDGGSAMMVMYGLETDRTLEKNDFNPPGGVPTHIMKLLKHYFSIITPEPMQRPTHIELTIEPDGKFNTVLGYGKPNWDLLPRSWPDDITAEDYTYIKAWPNGMDEGVKKLLDDPRSLIGFE